MHEDISKKLGLKVEKDYLPHLSLFNTKHDNSYIVNNMNDYSFIYEDKISYTIAIGLSTPNGMIAKILKQN